MLNFFKPFKFYVSPEVNGSVYKMGEPHRNIDVTISIEYAGSHFTKTVSTDNNGAFHFEPVTFHRWTKPLPLTTNLVSIWIYTIINNIEKTIWLSYRDRITPQEFVVENLKQLHCDIDSKDYIYYFKNEKPGAIPDCVNGICELHGFIKKDIQEEI